MDFDDDSDSPSIVEDVGNEIELGDDDDIEEGIAIDDIEREQPPISNAQWRELPASDFVSHVSVDIGKVDTTMLQHLRDQSKHILEQTHDRCLSMGYGPIVSTEEVRFTNCFLPATVLIELLEIINKNISIRQNQNVPQAKMRELELLIRYIFCLGVYQRSPSQVAANPNWFPAVENVIGELVGNSYDEKEERMRVLFSALDPHCVEKDDWKQPFQQNKRWRSIERKISEHCSGLVWKRGFHLCVDDDKVRNLL
jgi:hypothetical protein